MKNSLLTHYQKTKRNLPWRHTTDPYKIWVSEIFLQQTQVSRVIDFYEKFLQKFPNIETLSKASWEEFVPYFQGLGFYSRGRNMLKTAHIIMTEFSGKFPENKSELMQLAGVGNYTSSAIMSFAYQQNFPAFDVNLYRVLGRFFGFLEAEIKEKTNKNYKQVLQEIEKKAENYFYEADKISGKNDADLLNHAFMDLGSSMCTAKKVECGECPLKKECKFYCRGGALCPPNSTKGQPQGIAPTRSKTQNFPKISVMVLHHNKKYFLVKSSPLDSARGSEIWSFPEFSHDDGRVMDHRHFLQEKSILNFGIEISVRPPFLKQEIKNNSEISEYVFSRCQILRGEFFPEILDTKNEKISGKFFTKAEISELIQNKNTPEKFSEVFEKVLKMRL